jgi:hypothetical protein
MNTKEDIAAFYAECKAEGLKIDPATAEVTWWYAKVADPYGIEALPEEYSCTGREYFVRRPDGDLWVNTWHLPEATFKALKHRFLPSLIAKNQPSDTRNA